MSELLQKPHSDGYPDEDECSATDEFASSSHLPNPLRRRHRSEQHQLGGHEGDSRKTRPLQILAPGRQLSRNTCGPLASRRDFTGSGHVSLNTPSSSTGRVDR